jgi:hypothetical protein
MSRRQQLGKGVVVQVLLSAEEEVAVTEATLKVGGVGVLAAGHRLIEGLLAQYLLEGDDRGIGIAKLCLDTCILCHRDTAKAQQHNQQTQ